MSSKQPDSEYIIVTAPDRDTLQNAVNARVAQGWIPTGGPFQVQRRRLLRRRTLTFSSFSQALWREQSKPPATDAETRTK